MCLVLIHAAPVCTQSVKETAEQGMSSAEGKGESHPQLLHRDHPGWEALLGDKKGLRLIFSLLSPPQAQKW